MAAPVNILHLHSSFDLGGKEARAVRLMNAFGDRVNEQVLLPGVFVEEQMQWVKGRPEHLPMVLFVQIPQRDRVREELVERLHAVTADGFRQRDWQPHEMSIRLC